MTENFRLFAGLISFALALYFVHLSGSGPGGTAELKQAIARWYARTYGYEFKPENVMASSGAKHSIHTFLAATVGPGNDVIIPTPYWVSYSDLVTMTGANAVLIHTTAANKFKLTVPQLEAAITPNSRILMLNSPSNPTGTVYTREELAALAECFLQRTDGAILSDEIYELLMYGDAKPTCIATLKPEYRERVVTISGASKSYAMTGWRMGWTVAPANVIKAMDNIQSQETSCPSSITQYAMITALDSPETATSVAAMLKEFAVRKHLTCDHLHAMPGIRLVEPDGAFYAFFEVSNFYGKSFGGKTVTGSIEFCTALLEQGHVNLVPGAAFGADDFARMSFACSQDNIRTGLGKLATWLKTAAE